MRAVSDPPQPSLRTEASEVPSAEVRAGRSRARINQVLGRASLNLLDQVLSALTNVVLSFLVARAVDPDAFGAFSVAFLIFGLLIGLERSLVGQPLSIRFSGADGELRRASVGAAMATTIVLTLAAGAVIAVVAMALGGVLGATLLALAPVVPGLILQDTCRMVFFAHRRPLLAVVNDATWAVVQFAVMGLLYERGVGQPWPYVLAWGGGATVAAGLGLFQTSGVPRFDRLVWWLRGQSGLTGYLMLEYLLGASSSQGSFLLVGAVGSVGDVGSLRAAQTLLGPLAILGAAVKTFALPELSRRTDLRSGVRSRIGAGISLFMFLSALLYVGPLLLIPDGIGVQLLGRTWTGARAVLLPMSVFAVAASACGGPSLVIYATGQLRRTFVLHAFEAPAILVAMVIGAIVGGTPAAAWGLAVVETLMIPLWFLQMHVLLRTAPRSGG